MNFEERFDLLKVNYLASLKQRQLSAIFKSHSKDKLRDQFAYLQNFCRTVIAKGGVLKQRYKYANGQDDGRMFVVGPGIQQLPKEIRGFLMSHTLDIDMVNAHPTILRWLCHRYGVPCPLLDAYVANRDAHIGTGRFRDEMKRNYLVAINSDAPITTADERLWQFDKEIKAIQKIFFDMPHFAEIQPGRDSKNPRGSKLNRIMCINENHVLQSAIKLVTDNGYEVAVPMFDGMMLYWSNSIDETGLLKMLNESIEHLYPGLGLKWDKKEHYTTLRMDNGAGDDDDEPDSDDVDSSYSEGAGSANDIGDTYEAVRDFFQSKFIYLSESDEWYLRLSGNRLSCKYSFSSIKDQYSYLHYKEYSAEQEKVVRICLLDKHKSKFWSDPDREVYSAIDSIPPGLPIPEGVFNVWQPFLCTKLVGNIVDITAFHEHIKHISNYDDAIYNWILDWLRLVVLQPERKAGVVLNLLGNQGTGKSMLVSLIRKLIGSNRVYSTTSPETTVFCAFNANALDGRRLLAIEECTKKSMLVCKSELKDMVTADTLSIKQKYMKERTVQNTLCTILLSNDYDPAILEVNDRRNVVIQTSTRYMQNAEFWTGVASLYDTVDGLYSIYTYLESRPIAIVRAIDTALKREVIEECKHPVQLWLEAGLPEGWMVPGHRVNATEALGLYNSWARENGYKELTATGFGRFFIGHPTIKKIRANGSFYIFA